MPPFLDDDQPHEPPRSEAQIAGTLRLLGERPRRVLDLGCGRGRMLLPLARAGHAVTGMDNNERALDHLREALGREKLAATLISGDMTDEADWPAGPFDAVLCLGNTFMTLVDVAVAVRVMQCASRSLAADGALFIDDLPHDFWPQLTEGNWQSGVSEDGSMQMIWEEGDSVFALRTGGEVHADDWTISQRDRRFRLWSMGLLTLAAKLAGLSDPMRVAEAGLLVMTSTSRPPGDRS